ncbi:MAG: glycosyltransferase family 4 protein, partial [Sedimentisphaerales bacterium]|nr:glycosyltransferase family 4 protein [Sedimentisphaerales bacterium]
GFQRPLTLKFRKAKKLNILITAYCVDKNDVGGARMAFDWINRLARHVDICVITTGSKYCSTTGLEEHDNIKQIILKPHISFQKWSAFDHAAQPGYIEFFMRAYHVVRECVQKSHFDICHHILPRSIRYPTPLIAANIPMIIGPFHGGLTIPDNIMKKLQYKEKGFLSLRSFDSFRVHFDPILRMHYRKAKRLIISAPYVKKLLLPEYHSKCRVIPPPPTDMPIKGDILETGKSREKNDDDVVKLINVGRIVPSKGLEILIYAMTKLRDRNIFLTIYGRGYHEKNYKILSEKLNMTRKIRWAGFASHSEVMKAYASSDIFVFPSLKEPTGIALTEAMAAGLPVICVDAGGPAYIVNKSCGIKIPITTKDQMINMLALSLDSLIKDGKKRLEMGKNGQDRMRKMFTWDAAIAEMLNVYSEVIDER